MPDSLQVRATVSSSSEPRKHGQLSLTGRQSPAPPVARWVRFGIVPWSALVRAAPISNPDLASRPFNP